jgi:nitrile hydratase subunit beta
MRPRFSLGDRVKISARDVETHCRTPSYLRGKRGVIVRLFGEFRNPELLAYHTVGLPYQPLYQVEFDYAEVWGLEQPNTTITADIYQHWIEQAN